MTDEGLNGDSEKLNLLRWEGVAHAVLEAHHAGTAFARWSARGRRRSLEGAVALAGVVSAT